MTRPRERESQEEERGTAKALKQQRIWLVGKGRRKPEQLKGRGGGEGGALRAAARAGTMPKASQEPLQGFGRRVTRLDLHF